MVRKSAFAGHFYPGKKAELEKEMERLTPKTGEKRKVLGLVSPHAGYIYSGKCAGKGYGSVQVGEQVIVLGINHRGSRSAMVLDGNDSWETPLGSVVVDHNLRFELLNQTKIFTLETESGKTEHSLEVQIPFIQYANPKAAILPIAISTHRLEDLLAAGKELGELLKKHPEAMIVASTDMSHYVSASQAKMLDDLAIERMLALDPRGLLGIVETKSITMCGVAPTVVMLEAALAAGAQNAEVIDYTHSGVVTGDDSEVVAYLSLIVY